MAYAALLLLGLIGTSALKVNLFPDVKFPAISVITPYSNVQAEEIENLVTRPIEDALSAVSGVRRIRSLSQEGLSIVHIDLDWGSSTDSAIIQARQKVDLARSALPQDTGKSMIARFDPSREPIMILVANPKQIPFQQSREYIERNIRPLLERIEGVASISIQGGYRREIRVDIDRDRLRSYNLSLAQIGQNLDASNYTFPAGSVKKGKHEYQVKVKGEFDSVPAIGDAVVFVGQNGSPIQLSSLGTITDDFKDRTASAVHNGKSAIIILLRKEPDSNSVETAAAIRKALEEINGRFAEQIQFEVLHDSSSHIVESIDSVVTSAWLGALIAFAVLLLFLSDIKAAIIIVVSIPVSVVFTLLLMFLSNVSLNIMSLGGLALGTGMLVDNSIVVIESIQGFREKNAGVSLHESAIAGASAVAGSVFASTLTSVIVFLPILFVPGIAGAIFRDLSLTVTYSLTGSMIVALTLIPMLAALPAAVVGSRFGAITDRLDRRLHPFYAYASRAVLDLQDAYTRSLGRFIMHPRPLFNTLMLLSIGGLILLFSLRRELFPATDTGILDLKIVLEEGTTVDDAERFLIDLQKHLLADEQNPISHITSSIGTEEDDIEARMHGKKKPHHTETVIYLRDKSETDRYLQVVQKAVYEIPGIKAEIRKRGDILQSLLGNDAKILVDTESAVREHARSVSERIRQKLAADERVIHLTGSSKPSIPEIRITLDRLRLAGMGLSVRDAGIALRSAVSGDVATVFREQDREIDVRLRLRKQDREAPSDLRSIPATLPDGKMIELSSLIESRQAVGYETILREDQRRMERLELEADSGKEQELLDDLQVIKGEQEADPSIQVRVQKTNQETLQSLQNLMLAFLLSSVLIYQLLAAQFESLIHPITLILSIPLMFAGTAFALFVTGNTLNIQSTIGLVMLTGIVVNNAIVLYEVITERLAALPASERLTHLPDILNDAGRERLRPILLSTLTTVLALLPMALEIGPGAEMQAPLAVVVIGGLSVSTVLTLLCFPVLFYTIEKALAKRRGIVR